MMAQWMIFFITFSGLVNDLIKNTKPVPSAAKRHPRKNYRHLWCSEPKCRLPETKKPLIQTDFQISIKSNETGAFLQKETRATKKTGPSFSSFPSVKNLIVSSFPQGARRFFG
jgi:hypothetical protein